MVKPINQIYQGLQKLIGLHRQLLDTVRMEHDALVQADLKSIEECTFAKQALIEAIKQLETERLKAIGELAVLWKKAPSELTLSKIIIEVQGNDLKFADSLRSALNTLTIMVKRVAEQNDENRILVERCLEHIREMKKNVLGEATPKSDVYTAKGKKASNGASSRLLSKEA